MKTKEKKYLNMYLRFVFQAIVSKVDSIVLMQMHPNLEIQLAALVLQDKV